MAPEMTTTDTVRLDVRALTVSDSSNIEAVGYHAESSTLRVWFKGGRMYDYDGVSPDQFAAMVSAPSVGSYHARNIKPLHTCTRYQPGAGGGEKPDSP